MASKQFYEPSIAELDAAKTIAGPFEQFDGSVCMLCYAMLTSHRCSEVHIGY